MKRVVRLRKAIDAGYKVLDELQEIYVELTDPDAPVLEGLNIDYDITGDSVESIKSEIEESYPRIEDLRIGDEDLVLKARVAAIESRKGEKDGREWAIKRLVLNDNTSSIALPLFNEQIEKARGIEVDDWVIVHCWKTEMYKGNLQLVPGARLNITRISSDGRA